MPVAKFAEQKQISEQERLHIATQVNEELVEHLYRGCLQGTVGGAVFSIIFYVAYRGYTSPWLLNTWFIVFNSMMLSLSAVYFLYKRYRTRLSIVQWDKLYAIVMTGCAIVWVPFIYVLPVETIRQFFGLLAYFMASTGYAMGTIGHFRLCVTTLCIMLLSLVAWCFLQGSLPYYLVAAYALIYMFFMFGTNLRSTAWFKESLKLKLENNLVSYQANHDSLTDLPNSRMLPQYIQSTIKAARETGEMFALVCFSLNRMEWIYDSMGHEAGDIIMLSLTRRLENLAEQLAQGGKKLIVTISRKDTFDIIIAPLQPEEAEQSLNLLFTMLEEPFYVQDKPVILTASLGVSFYPRDGETGQTLLSNADAAMFNAKQFGGNRLAFYKPEINALLPKQLELENDLHAALDQQQFLLYYQPLVDARTGIIVGSEALIRWQHPVHGFISPGSFIPLAEETGLIVPMGAWVMKEACRQTRVWQEMGFKDLKVSVNVAGKQLTHDDFTLTIKNVLQESQFDVRYLELEITETAILDEKVIEIIKEFSRMGLSLAVDDFGTGYSGLSYLKRFSVDKLKIDQSFVRDIPSNRDSMAIVSAILAMARELEIKTLAEGVETKEQLQFLKTKGCDFIQGYYFSKPLEAGHFTKLLLNYRSMPVYLQT